ncbi:CAAX prenyl protease-related protein [Massilia endophytica]|uniref:CAAX prenyl protease-related protein n=1 Tax=Massilia endophytica TaxID=2899220 RepID=UPI001E548157|nr:CAAX prenyl protease-related protein [Massilia endophytica]UGQ47630.1 CAAX prenyl protease-related protein [Massilia endophytica]
MTLPQQDPPTVGTAARPEAAHGPLLYRSAWARILPFALYMAFIAVSDTLQRFGWTVKELHWLYPVKVAVVLLALLAFRRSYSELAWQPLRARTWLASVATGLAVLVLWINLDAGWMQIGSPAGYQPLTESGQPDWLLIALRLAGAALVVPLMEELFWRSFLLRWIDHPGFLTVPPALVTAKALAFTTVLFGFEHSLWLAGMVAGAAYGLLYMRTGTLWAPIIAHTVTNSMLGVWVVTTGNWTYW